MHTPSYHPVMLIVTSIVIGIATVLGIEWANVIRATVNYYHPVDNKAALKTQYTYAIILTISLSVVLYGAAVIMKDFLHKK